MEFDQSILLIPSLIISALYGFFLVNPMRFLELAWDRGLYFSALIAASLTVVYLTQSGIAFVIEILMLLAVVAITAVRFPVLRFVEPCPGDGVVKINRIIHRHFWPSPFVRAASCYHAFRRGRVAGILPYVEMIDGFQYVYGGKTYDSLKDLEGIKPTVVLHAEHALLKTLG